MGFEILLGDSWGLSCLASVCLPFSLYVVLDVLFLVDVAVCHVLVVFMVPPLAVSPLSVKLVSS